MRRGLLIVAAVLVTAGGCSSDDDSSDVTFGPASTMAPSRTVPPEAVEFCSLDGELLAVGDLLQQLEEPLQLLVQGDLTGAIDPMEKLYDTLDRGSEVLGRVDSSAPPEISADVHLVVGSILVGFDKIPPRDAMIGALRNEDDAAVAGLLTEFEGAFAELQRPSPEVDAAGSRMRDYIAATC